LVPFALIALLINRQNLLNGEEVPAGASGVNAVFSDGIHDARQRLLDLRDVSKPRKTRSKDIELAENLCGVLNALMVALMVVTEFLSTKSGGTAEGAIGHAMVTGGAGHGPSKKRAISCQASAFR
jgi:hypothetical protein